MREWQSLSHARWYCRYDLMIVPKYRKRAIFGQLRRQIGGILRELCVQHEIDLVEGHAMPDHVPPVEFSIDGRQETNQEMSEDPQHRANDRRSPKR